MKLVARTTKTRIKAVIDLVPRDQPIDTNNPIDPNPYGANPINHAGETTFQYGIAEPQMKYGEALYVCEDDHTHLAGDLEVHHPDGRIEPVEGEVASRPSRALGLPSEQRLQALAYASWIAHSADEFERGLIDEITRDRVHKRARDYAQAAGATEILNAILAVLQA